MYVTQKQRSLTYDYCSIRVVEFFWVWSIVFGSVRVWSIVFGSVKMSLLGGVVAGEREGGRQSLPREKISQIFAYGTLFS